MLELFPSPFSCSNNFILSKIPLELQEKNRLFDSLRDPVVTAGNSSNLTFDLFPVLLLPQVFSSKNISFANSIKILSCEVARSTL